MKPLALLLAMAVAFPALAEDSPLDFKRGPLDADLGGIATLKIPAGVASSNGGRPVMAS